MKGTFCWSEPGQKLIAHAPRAGQHLADLSRVFVLASIFLEILRGR